MDQENNMPAQSSAPAYVAAPKLDFAQLLSDAWQLGQTKFWNLFGIYLIMTVIMVVAIILAGLAGGVIGLVISMAKLPALLVLFIALAVLALIVLLVWVSAWGLIASYRYLDHSSNPTVGEMIAEARPKAWDLVPTMIAVILAVIGGFFAFVIPGIIMGISLSFVLIVAVLEDKKMWPALVRSRDLVRGRWWNVFVISLAFFIMVFILLAATGMSYSPLTVILTPFCYILSYVMYKKLASFPPAALPTNRGDWYYKAAAAFGILLIAAGILAATFAAGKDWDGLRNKFESKRNRDNFENRYYDDEYYEDNFETMMDDRRMGDMPLDFEMIDLK